MNRALFILISIILAGMLISCTTDTTEPEIGDDSELIQLIKNAPNKQIIDVTELPSASRNVLETVYGEDIVDASKIAPELGYEIDMMRGSRARLGEEMQAYFDLTGRELRDGDGRGSGGEEECFEYVLPVTFVMPDGSTITIENEEDWIEIREWYLANPNVREEPVLQYPADIIFRDGTTWTLNSDEDLRRAYAFCDDGSGGGEQCFEYVLPVTFVMPDGSTITIKDEEDWMEIRNWYEANPNVREEPVLQYPADIIFRDGTTWTLNSDEDLHEAYAYCAGR